MKRYWIVHPKFCTNPVNENHAVYIALIVLILCVSKLRILVPDNSATCGNYLWFQPQVMAVIDWEGASWGHPYEDLAYFCFPFHFPAELEFMPMGKVGKYTSLLLTIQHELPSQAAQFHDTSRWISGVTHPNIPVFPIAPLAVKRPISRPIFIGWERDT